MSLSNVDEVLLKMLRSLLSHSYFRSTIFLEIFEYKVPFNSLPLPRCSLEDGFIQMILSKIVFSMPDLSKSCQASSHLVTDSVVWRKLLVPCGFLVNLPFLGDLFILMFLLMGQGSLSCFYLWEKVSSPWESKAAFPSYSIQERCMGRCIVNNLAIYFQSNLKIMRYIC